MKAFGVTCEKCGSDSEREWGGEMRRVAEEEVVVVAGLRYDLDKHVVCHDSPKHVDMGRGCLWNVSVEA
jgi:hypothetical protein